MLHLTHQNSEDSAPALDEHMAAKDRVADLNARYRHFGTSYLLEAVLTRGIFDRVAMVSSFGADSAVLLHLIAQIDRALPVLFIDTALLFEETLTYQQILAAHLGLTNVQVIRAKARTVDAVDPYGALRFSDPDACCTLRKTQPLNDALEGYDAWITGRKRHQARTRQDLGYFDLDDGSSRIKINPLIDWKPARLKAHLDTHSLPRHPLLAKGYPSIGCAPCTTRVAHGEDPRAGRWRGIGKTECGLHTPTQTGDAQ
jgi:phosphoadenosine phosphosulfate reductase